MLLQGTGTVTAMSRGSISAACLMHRLQPVEGATGSAGKAETPREVTVVTRLVAMGSEVASTPSETPESKAEGSTPVSRKRKRSTEAEQGAEPSKKGATKADSTKRNVQNGGEGGKVATGRVTRRSTAKGKERAN